MKQLTGSVGGAQGNNPFNAPSSGALVRMEENPGYKANFLGTEVYFASEADFLKVQMAYEKKKRAAGPSVDSEDEGGSGNFLEVAGGAIKTVGAFLAGRNLADKVDQIDDALDEQKAARAELAQLQNDTTYARIVPILLRLFDAERDATEAAQSALEDQVLAEDLRVGGGVAQLVQQFSKRSGGLSSGSGFGTAAAAGIGGLGLGMMFSRKERDNKRR